MIIDDLNTDIARDKTDKTVSFTTAPLARNYTDEQIEAAAGNIYDNNFTKTTLCGCA